MHILDFLRNAGKQSGQDINNMVKVEYHLICSGTLFPDNFQGDWTKSDAARILLQAPVKLLVASRPYDDYPQELVMRFTVALVTETEGACSYTQHPDQEIASDIAALLTLLCHRLITVSAKVTTQYLDSNMPPIIADYPCPAVTTAKMSYWKPRPPSFIHDADDVKVESYHPAPQSFNSNKIRDILLGFPQLEVAPAVIRAVRLCALAMELIESQAEICYQLLISAVETIAGVSLANWEPEKEEKIASKNALISYAINNEKISKDKAERLVIEACKGNPWSGKKFKKFLLENMNHDEITNQDNLFIVPEFFCPKKNEIEEALEKVYQTRSGATHSGHSFPVSATIGPSVAMPLKALFNTTFNKQRPFPPIGWFERVVNSAICGFLKSHLKQHSPAIRDAATRKQNV